MQIFKILRLFGIVLLALLASGDLHAYTLSQFNQSWCVASFPSSYVSGSFSITETSAAEITKNQSNRTMTFDVPAGFQFNTTGGTYSVSGISANDITAISISSITTTRITVRMSVSNTAQTDLNTITVNCQIAATASGSSGIIYRSGGSIKINRSTSNPTTAESLGTLSAYTIMSYTSATTAQPNTSAVPQAINDVEILQIQVVISGTCNTASVTQFQFSTDGNNGTGSNNPATNISAARVYYTGLNSTFAPTGLFGSFSSPSGAFTITGTQQLMEGTNYFWLAYDVPSGAIAGALLDASCSSLTLNNSIGAKTPTQQSPTGSRSISGTSQFYTRASGNWNDNTNWSLTDGGASCSCLPNASSNVFINTNHLLQLDVPATVSYLTIKDGAQLYDNGSSALTVSNNLNTQGSGRFNTTGSISIGGNLVLSGTGSSTTTASLAVSGNTTIGSGNSLTANGAAGNNITLQGHLSLSGSISSGTSGATIIMNGAAAQTISGSGTINGSGELTLSTSAKTISTGSSITINPATTISGAITVTNNGTLTFNNNLNGSVSGSTFVNAANATLNLKAGLLTTGSLTATAVPNTIEYSHTGAQTIKAGTYNILKISGSGNKTLAGAITVNNELNLSGTSVTIAGTNTLSGAGRLTMSGTAELTIAKTGVTVPELTGVYALSGGTITLNQTAAATQTVRGITYYNLTLDGSNAASTFDLTALTDIAGSLTIQNRSIISSNPILSIAGNLVHSSLGSNTLANDLTVDGTTTISAGTFNLNAKYFSSGGLTLASGATLNATNSTIEITNGNWTQNGGTFTATGSTVWFDGTAAQTIGGTASTTFNHLTLQNTAVASPQFTFGNNVQVNGTLTLSSGNSNLGGYTLTLGSSAASTGTLAHTSGWFYNGNLKRWYPASVIAAGAAAGFFPLGSSSDTRYCYVFAPSSAPSAGGTITLSHTHTSGVTNVSITDGSYSIDRRYNSYWSISTGDGLTGGTWSLRTSGTGLSALSDVTLLRLSTATTANGTAGTNAGTSSDPQVNRSGLTLAQIGGSYYWGYSQTALPVELIRFTATATGNAIDLLWETASESNSSHFSLFRAGNNQQYNLLQTIPSKGNSNALSVYTLRDNQPLRGINYYRLTETDIDGREKYLAIASASLQTTGHFTFSNPVGDQLWLQSDERFMGTLTIRISDASGRLVSVEEMLPADGSYRVPASMLQQGMYFFSISNGEEVLLRDRFLKQ